MCNTNDNILVQVDCSQSNDETNWVHNSANTLNTSNGRLVMEPSSQVVTYTRPLGNLDPSNNRIRFQCDLEVKKRPLSSTDEIEVEFDIVNGEGVVLETSCIQLNGMQDGQTYSHFLDRTYVYQGTQENLKLEIRFPAGWGNTLLIKDFKFFDFNYCPQSVRNYFIIDELFELSLAAAACGIQFTEWKVDNQETLTPLFFSENNLSIGGPTEPAWRYAKSDLDGANRQDQIPYNTFNPFIRALGLNFDIVNYYGGKPVSTATGADYGNGVMQIGLEKPIVLNGDLEAKKGAFFLDIDFTKNLLIKFKVIVNSSSTDLFNRPNIFREYTIKWNAFNCTKEFFYTDTLKNDELHDELHNGFLYGLTPFVTSAVNIGCDSEFSPSGEEGDFTFEMDFGTQVGNVGIAYNAYNIPDRFIIEWNGQTFDTGYVGHSTHDQALIDAGVDPSDINTGNPTTGEGQLIFNKTSQYPTTATITVMAPIGDTAWNVEGICDAVTVGNLVEVGEGDCGNMPSVWDAVYIGQGTQNYTPAVGDVVFEDVGLNTPYDGGNNFHRMRVYDSGMQIIVPYSFRINNNGVVGNVTPCIQQVNDLEILHQSNSNCMSCFTFRVNVPQGQSRQVEVSSSFAPGGVYGSGCLMATGSVSINADGTHNITETTIFVVAIDGASGSNQALSTVNVVVKDGANIEHTEAFTRSHSNSNC